MTARKPKSKSAERVAEVMEATASHIVAAIEDGLANPGEWSAPWHRADPAHMLPTNAATGAAYTGGNRMILALTSMMTGAPNYWATFNQWQDLTTHAEDCPNADPDRPTGRKGRRACPRVEGPGRPTWDDKRGEYVEGPRPTACPRTGVRRGEKATAYILRPIIKQEERDDGTTRDRLIGYKAHAVFHAGQVEGYEAPPAPAPALTDADALADVAAAYQWQRSSGAEVREEYGNPAAYDPAADRVLMPSRDQFHDPHGAWSTAAHELGHWTGHASRLNRAEGFGNRFGSEGYAAEELVAEMSAAFTLAAIGRSAQPREDHAHYLASWLKVLTDDPAHLFHVAGKAEAASRYVLDCIDRRTVATREAA